MLRVRRPASRTRANASTNNLFNIWDFKEFKSKLDYFEADKKAVMDKMNLIKHKEAINYINNG